jgi:hypothetical protein
LTVKIIWIIALIISAGLCGYMVYGSIVNYMQFGVVTSIRVTAENPMVFPTVTICNLNPFVTDASFYMLNNIVESNFGLNTSNILNGVPKLVVINSNYQLWERYFVPRYVATSVLISQSEQMKKMIGFPFQKFVISCFYGITPCYEDDFTWYIYYFFIC